MSKPTSDDSYSDEEAARRRDEVIRRMLNTPPQPRPTKPRDEQEGEERPARKGRAHRPKPRP